MSAGERSSAPRVGALPSLEGRCLNAFRIRWGARIYFLDVGI